MSLPCISACLPGSSHHRSPSSTHPFQHVPAIIIKRGARSPFRFPSACAREKAAIRLAAASACVVGERVYDHRLRTRGCARQPASGSVPADLPARRRPLGVAFRVRRVDSPSVHASASQVPQRHRAQSLPIADSLVGFRTGRPETGLPG